MDVRRFHGPVLSFKLRERCGLMTQTLHDGLGRRIGRNHETPIAPRLLNDVCTFDVSAQLYVGPLHVPDDVREAGCVRGNLSFSLLLPGTQKAALTSSNKPA